VASPRTPDCQTLRTFSLCCYAPSSQDVPALCQVDARPVTPTHETEQQATFQLQVLTLLQNRRLSKAAGSKTLEMCALLEDCVRERTMEESGWKSLPGNLNMGVAFSSSKNQGPISGPFSQGNIVQIVTAEAGRCQLIHCCPCRSRWSGCFQWSRCPSHLNWISP